MTSSNPSQLTLSFEPALPERFSSLRHAETETERRLREANERIELLLHDKRVLTDALRGVSA